MWTVVVRDPQGKEVKRLPLSSRLVVGRTPQCEILIDSNLVSRQHARIELFKDKPVFVDLGSSNGSLLNGQAVTKPTLVDERHQIEIAGYKIGFEKNKVPEAGPSSTPAPPSIDELVPMGPSATIAATSKPAAVPEIKIPEQNPGVPPRKEVNWNSATDVFERQLQGIRAHRELQAKLNGNPKVLQFVISRDQKEVSIKIVDPTEKRGYRYFIFCRSHPEGQYPGLDAVWLREFGVDDTNYKEPKKAMQELVQRIAGTLA